MSTKTYKNPIKNRTSHYNKLPVELFQLKDLSNSAFRLYCYLCSWDEAFPGYEKIKEAVGLSKGTVTSAINELVDRRMISYIQGGRYGGPRSNTYTITDPSTWDMTSLENGPVQELGRSRNNDGTFSKQERPALNLNSTCLTFREVPALNLGSTNTNKNTYTNEEE